MIMKAPSANIMNGLQKSVLTLYSYDDKPDDISIPNVLRQSLTLIGTMPLISVYGYHAYQHYNNGKSLVIRYPSPELSTAENILRMMRDDGQYTELEARVLDICLVLHAEHGGGNNSTFTTHVVSSTGTDTYSAVAASLGSLKGPRHGGANLKVENMFSDIKAHVSNWSDEGAITDYLQKMINREVFDRSGLIYGMGHAVYTMSDPRAVVLKEYARSPFRGEGAPGGVPPVRDSGKEGVGTSDGSQEPVQTHLLQRGLLQRICIFHAGDSPPSCLRRSLPSPEFPAGVRTGSRSW